MSSAFTITLYIRGFTVLGLIVFGNYWQLVSGATSAQKYKSQNTRSQTKNFRSYTLDKLCSPARLSVMFQGDLGIWGFGDSGIRGFGERERGREGERGRGREGERERGREGERG